MRQYEVFLVNLDPSIGTEIKKTRPAVIVSPNLLNRHLNTVIVAPMTHTTTGFPCRVSTNFRHQPGEIALDQLRAVDKSRLIKRLGKLVTSAQVDCRSKLQAIFG